MSYGLRFQATYGVNSKRGYVKIYENGYSGSVMTLTLRQTSGIRITQKIDNWEDHIFKHTCEINIQNSEDDYFTLIDLMHPTNLQFKVVVTIIGEQLFSWSEGYEEINLFTGFINVESVKQKYLQHNVLRLVASGFLNKLDNVHPASVDSFQNITFVNLIREILDRVGSTSNISVLAGILSVPNNGYSDYRTFLNQTGINTGVFWKNNVEKVSSKEILEKIMKAFQCYLYYWDGNYYIVQYHLIWTSESTKPYLTYVKGYTYDPDDIAIDGSEYVLIREVHDLVFRDRSQELHTFPGYSKVTVKIENQNFWSIVSSNLANTVIDGTTTIPSVGQWKAYQPSSQTVLAYDKAGLPYKGLINAIHREIDKKTYGYTEREGINNPYPYFDRGLRTLLKLDYDGEMSLNLEWSFLDVQGLYYNESLSYTPYRLTDEWVYRFPVHFYFYDEDLNPIGFIYAYGGYNSEDYRYWDTTSHASTVIPYIWVEKNGNEAENGIFKLNIKIDLDKLQGDELPLDVYYVEVGLMTEIVNKRTKPHVVNHVVGFDAYIGDIRLSLEQETVPANYIEGQSNIDFIESKDITIFFAEMPNFNYANSVLAGSNLESNVTSWSRGATSGVSLVDFILIDKSRIGNRVRDRIVSDVQFSELLRPFDMFIEPKQSNKKFVITGTVYDVTEDKYEVTLDEYDNTTTINLI